MFAYSILNVYLRRMEQNSGKWFNIFKYGCTEIAVAVYKTIYYIQMSPFHSGHWAQFLILQSKMDVWNGMDLHVITVL